MVNLLELRDGTRFESFCKALLVAKYDTIQTYSAPDGGIDAFHVETETVFQFYFPEQAPRKDKIDADIKKVLNSGAPFKIWILILPKDPTPKRIEWVQTAFSGTTVHAEIWGKTQIEKLLREYPSVRDAFFPSDVKKAIRRLAKGKKPCVGDAEEWQAINAEECEELREMMNRLAEASAKRKRRKTSGRDFSHEFGEFNSHFRLSSYDHLHRDRMGEARSYLEQKLYARRQGEPKSIQRNRRIGGIQGIKNALGISDAEYRRELLRATGSASLSQMSEKQLELAFRHFKDKQRLHESQLP